VEHVVARAEVRVFLAAARGPLRRQEVESGELVAIADPGLAAVGQEDRVEGEVPLPMRE
jgi:hypothetical protein